jgi:hypothetical protein
MSDDDDFDLDITYSVGHELGIQSSASALHPNKPAAAATIDDDDVTASEEDDDLDYIPSIKMHRDTASSQDALPQAANMRTRKAKPKNQYSESEGEEEDGEEPVRTTLHPSGGGGERIVMTDASSDDEVLADWKRRRDERLSKGSNSKKRNTKAKTSSSTTTKRVKFISTSKNPPKSKRVQTWKHSDDEREVDGTQNERKALPSYLQGKKAHLDRAKKELKKGEDVLAAFKVPPCYDNIEFSDDERLVCV